MLKYLKHSIFFFCLELLTLAFILWELKGPVVLNYLMFMLVGFSLQFFWPIILFDLFHVKLPFNQGWFFIIMVVPTILLWSVSVIIAIKSAWELFTGTIFPF